MDNKMVIGNVESELGFKRFGFGDRSWRWKRRYFSRYRMDPDKEMNRHIVIVGESGVGKSSSCKSIIRSLCADGSKIAILDPHNEYIGISEAISAEVYDASRNGINVFELDGLSERERASEITGMLKRNFKLGEVQGYTLYRCILYAYDYAERAGRSPNIHNLIYAVKVFKKNSNTSAERNILESLERRLSLLDTGGFERSADMKSILEHNSVFLLSSLHTTEAQSIYIEGFLRKIYTNMLSSEKGRMNLYIVIDEAQKLGDNPIIGRLAAEGRKYGIGIIALSQRMKPVDKDLRANASTIVSFRTREPEELNYIANFMAGGNEMGRFIEVKKALRSLGIGRAVISSSRSRNPILVKFSECIDETENGRFRAVQFARGGIERDPLISGLNSMGIENPYSLVESMEESGTLRAYQIRSGRYAGMWYISDNHNSPEHDVMVGIISRRLSELGIKNRIYNSSYGPDIIAYCKGRAIAIEYETGSKDTEATARMLDERKKKYAVVLVVNERLYEKYSKRFGSCFPATLVGDREFEIEMNRAAS